jgi:hypothetical protein
MPISFTKGQQHVAVLWFCGGAVAMVILIAQSIVGTWGAWTSDAWSWLLPTILPTLTLIVATFAAEAGTTAKKTEVNLFPYYLCLALSAFYLACVIVILCAVNLVQTKPLELMKMSSLWLAPLQGLLSAIIGVFFVKRSDSSSSASEPEKTP